MRMDPVTVLLRREIDFTPVAIRALPVCPEAPESVAAPRRSPFRLSSPPQNKPRHSRYLQDVLRADVSSVNEVGRGCDVIHSRSHPLNAVISAAAAVQRLDVEANARGGQASSTCAERIAGGTALAKKHAVSCIIIRPWPDVLYYV